MKRLLIILAMLSILPASANDGLDRLESAHPVLYGIGWYLATPLRLAYRTSKLVVREVGSIGYLIAGKGELNASSADFYAQELVSRD